MSFPQLLRHFVDFSAKYEVQLSGQSEHIILKRDHSLRVHALASRIARTENVSDIFPYRLAALVHDIGRFPQFVQYGTYRDDDSVDHGELGAILLEQGSFLAPVSEDVRPMIISVVRLHNKKIVPRGLDRLTHSVLTVVRDADKLDIVPVVLHTLESGRLEKGVVTMGLAHVPERWTPEILDQVAQGTAASYADLRFINDFLVLLASWGQQLTHKASRNIFFRRGYLNRIFALLPHHTDFIQLKMILETRLQDNWCQTNASSTLRMRP
ncbi:MAG: HD domain-containing protein [Desulfovibrionales bacterium]|nr:HD domain-containing protein [Desulfovibrionales bacterium]